MIAQLQNENPPPKVKIIMKKAFRHTPSEKVATKTRKKAVKKLVPGTKLTEEELYDHPIFHTRYAGKLIKYIRPFDPVWPNEPKS
jgi:hypothetical protein